MQEQQTKTVFTVALASGAYYIFQPSFDNVVALGLVVKNQNGKWHVVGGFAGLEAERKLAAWALQCGAKVTEKPNGFIDTGLYDWSLVAEWIGSASTLLRHKDFVLTDGVISTGGGGKACDERQHYWAATGLKSEVYDGKKGIPVWALLLNHLAVFSQPRFKQTFFKSAMGVEDAQTEQKLTTAEAKTRYYGQQFKAPAAYVRYALENARKLGLLVEK